MSGEGHAPCGLCRNHLDVDEPKVPRVAWQEGVRHPRPIGRHGSDSECHPFSRASLAQVLADRPSRARQSCLRDICCGSTTRRDPRLLGPGLQRPSSISDGGIARSRDRRMSLDYDHRFAQARDHHHPTSRLGTWTVENLSRLACLEVSHVPCMSLQRRWPPRQWGGQPGRPRLACPARLVARQLPSLQPPFSRVRRSTWRRRIAAMPHPGPMRPPPPPLHPPLVGPHVVAPWVVSSAVGFHRWLPHPSETFRPPVVRRQLDRHQ